MHHAVVVTTGASGVRRALAPTAWMVLEEFLLRSNTSDGVALPDGVSLTSPAPAAPRKRVRVDALDLSQLSLAIKS